LENNSKIHSKKRNSFKKEISIDCFFKKEEEEKVEEKREKRKKDVCTFII
jgi:hypothetical protein